MANNIVIGILGESNGFDDLNAKIAALIQQNDKLLQQEKQLKKEGNIAIVYAKNADEQSAAVQKYGKAQADVRTKIIENRKAIEELNNAMKQMPGAAVADATQKSFKTLRRELEENIKAATLAGKTGTKEFQEWTKQAARLNDIQGDVQRQIKGMASDTRGFDTLLEGTQLIAGGFSVAQGAMSLFGVEEEKVQQAMVKLQSLIAITTGLQQLQNAMQKESNLGLMLGSIQTAVLAEKEILLRAARIANIRTSAQQVVSETANTAATAGQAVAATAGTAANIGLAGAFRLVGVAIKSIPVFGWIIAGIGLLITMVSLLGKSSKKTKEEQESLNKEIENSRAANEKAAKTLAGQYTIIKNLQSQWQALGGNLQKQKKFVTENKDEFAKLGVEVNNVSDAENVLIKNTDAVISALKSRAKATAAQEKATELYKKAIEQQMLLEKFAVKSFLSIDDDLQDPGYAIAVIKESQKMAEEANKNIQADKNIQEGIDNIMKEGDRFFDYYITESNNAAEILKQNGIKVVTDTNNSQRNITKNLNSEIEKRKKAEEELQNFIKTIKNENTANEANKGLLAEVKEAKETEIAIINARLAESEIGSEQELLIVKEKLKKQAELERLNIQLSSDNATMAAAKIREINANLLNDLANVDANFAEKEATKQLAGINAAADAVALEAKQKFAAGVISETKYNDIVKNIARERTNAEIAELQRQIEAKEAAGESIIELQAELNEKLNEQADQQIEIEHERDQARMQVIQESMNLIAEIGNALFDAQSARLDQELANLQHYYTTDAEEAKKNKDLKLISETELARKELEIKQKQAKAEKAQAIFQIALNTAMSIAKTASIMGFPASIPFIAIAAAMGLVQLAVVASKPLPKYAKGRKAKVGAGEYAWVGEQGPEIMYIPRGAGIMPAADSRLAMAGNARMFNKWEMPVLNTWLQNANLTPNFEVIKEKAATENHNRINYKKLGQVIAKNVKIPKQNAVSVNIDRNGLNITNGGTTTKPLNNKYSW